MATPLLQRSQRISLFAFAFVVLLWLGLAKALPAQAATSYVVTNCTALGVADAMNFMNNNSVTDGIISFNCNNTHAPATINISYPGGYGVATSAAYTMDGGGLITLSGGNANRVLNVQANAALTLTNLSVINGNAGADYGGCIFNFSGKLRLDNVTLQNCRTADTYLGGAIYTSGNSRLTVSGSRILSGTSSHGGGIFSGGTLVIVNSIIADNRATTGDGGGLNVTGNATISGSQIERNRASGGDGGGLYAASASNVTIQNSLLASNVTTVTTFASGGGLYSLGSLTVTNSTLSNNLARYGGGMDSEGTALLTNTTLSGNRATTAGGGMFNAGQTTVSNSTLSGNSANLSGGGIDNNGSLTVTNTLLGGNKAYVSGGGLTNESLATVSDSTLSGNWAPDGGGIFNYAQTLTLRSSTLSDNEATQGGGIYTTNNADAIVSNATLSGNLALNGGGIFNQGDTTLANVTLNNRALLTGTAHNLYLFAGVLTLTHTIVNFDVAYGANCIGADTPKKVSGGHNLASDAFCSLAATGDQQGALVPILLGSLANHGGPTQTHLPRLGSAALNTGDNAVCASPPVNNLDQRGVLRPQGAVCDIGAVERQPSDSDVVPWLYLPLIRR